MKTYLWLPLSCLNVAVAILLRKVSVAAVSSFAFNAAKLSTNLSFYPPFFPQQNEMIPDTKYVCMQVFLFFCP